MPLCPCQIPSLQTQKKDILTHISLLKDSFQEAITGRCHLENINGVVLQKVVEYFYYNERHRESIGVPNMDIPPELCLELLMAADYLDT